MCNPSLKDKDISYNLTQYLQNNVCHVTGDVVDMNSDLHILLLKALSLKSLHIVAKGWKSLGKFFISQQIWANKVLKTQKFNLETNKLD